MKVIVVSRYPSFRLENPADYRFSVARGNGRSPVFCYCTDRSPVFCYCTDRSCRVSLLYRPLPRVSLLYRPFLPCFVMVPSADRSPVFRSARSLVFRYFCLCSRPFSCSRVSFISGRRCCCPTNRSPASAFQETVVFNTMLPAH